MFYNRKTLLCEAGYLNNFILICRFKLLLYVIDISDKIEKGIQIIQMRTMFGCANRNIYLHIQIPHHFCKVTKTSLL